MYNPFSRILSRGRLQAVMILSLAIMFQVLSPIAYASESDFIIENGVLVKYAGQDDEVVVPDGVTSIGESAFSLNNKLTSIVIPESVTEIRQDAFHGCSALVDVQLPDGLIRIGIGSFSSCSSLKSIKIPDSVEYIGEGAFLRCGALESFTFPAGLTSLESYVLGACDSLTNVCIAGVFEMFNAQVFYSKPYSGETIRVAALPASNLTRVYVDENCVAFSDIDGVVYNKEKTELVYCPNREESTFAIPGGVTSISDSAFITYPRLETLIVPDSVTDFGDSVFFKDTWTSGGTGRSMYTILIYGTAKSAAETYAWNNEHRFRAGDPLNNPNPPFSKFILPLSACIPAIFCAILRWYSRRRKYYMSRISDGTGNCILCGRRTKHIYTYYSGRIEDFRSTNEYLAGGQYNVRRTTYSGLMSENKHLCPKCLLIANLIRMAKALIPAVILCLITSGILMHYAAYMEARHIIIIVVLYSILTFVLCGASAYSVIFAIMRLARLVFRLKGNYDDAAQKIIEGLPSKNGYGYLTPGEFMQLKVQR